MKHPLKLTIAVLILFFGCNTQNDPDEGSSANIYVLNEGNFGQANASITSYNPETGVVNQNVYEAVNGTPIGDALHSATLIDGRLYLVVNNSHKIEVVDPETFENIGTISIADEASPRYMAQVGENKAYVTNLYAGNVAIIDLENMQQTGTIEVGDNPEGIAIVGNKAFVANSGFGRGNTVTVIHTETDEVINNITVGFNPVSVQADEQGRVWVVCVGAYDNFDTVEEDESTPGEIYLLNGDTGDIIEQIEVGGHPGELVLDSATGKGYLSNGGSVNVLDMNTIEVEDENFINRSFYALGINKTDGVLSIWGADAGNFSQDGMAYQYDVTGAVVDSFTTGLIPGHFVFLDH